MDNNDGTFSMGEEPRGYAITGKIMLSALVVLFGIVVFMVVLHLYARWYITRVRRRNRVNRRTQIVFYVDNLIPGSAAVQNRGLDNEVLNSLPVFVYSSKKPVQVSECAVCLSEFEDGETGRVLPKCNHCFHIECIHMWLHTHSTCPLCRSDVEPVQQVENNQSVVQIGANEGMEVQAEPGQSSGSNGRFPSRTESFRSGRKRLDFSAVGIEIPRRNKLENEVSLSSPGSQSFRSPSSRLSSIKRILSMNKKSPVGTGTSCTNSVDSEFDLETGLNQGQTLQFLQTS